MTQKSSILSYLERLSPELLGNVFENVFESSLDHPCSDTVITSTCFPWPAQNAIARTSTTIRDRYDQWVFGRSAYVYYSSPKHTSQSSELLKWFERVGPVRRGSLRRLSLQMYASELLFIFAPPEAAGMLRIPDDKPGWTKLREMVRGLKLNELVIEVIPVTCPEPCKAGRFTDVGYSAAEPKVDGSRPAHFIADSRWVCKAVLESLPQGLREVTTFGLDGNVRVMAKEMQHLAGCSWEALRSSTEGWHRCDVLSCHDFVQIKSVWGVAERNKYRIPVIFGGERGVGLLDGDNDED